MATPAAIAPVYVSAIALVVLAVHAARRSALGRAPVGAPAFALAALALAVWSLATAFGALAEDPRAARLWARAQYLGIAPLPVLWLVFALLYTGRLSRVGSARIAALGLVPAATVLLALTNPLHGLVWSDVALGPGAGDLDLRRGVWFWGVHTPYSYALLLLALLVFARAATSPRPRSLEGRARATLFAVATVVPLAINALYIAGALPGVRFDPTPLGFAVCAALVAFGLFRLHLFDPLPLGYDAAFRALPDAALIVDAEERLLDLNPAAATIFGLRHGRVVDRPVREALPDWDELAACARVGGELQRDRGRPVRLALRSAPLIGPDGSPGGLVLLASDVSRLRWAEVRMDLDPLTDLPNRRRFAEEGARALGIAAREGWTDAIAFVDLDRFKPINDELGHEAGDRVLGVVADRLRVLVRQGDLLARFGGDEFVLLMHDLDAAAALEVAARVRESVGEPLEAAGREVRVGASVGVALYPWHSHLLSELVAMADAAMYRAKSGGGGAALYEPDDPPATGSALGRGPPGGGDLA